MAAYFIRGDFVLRSGVYPADRGAEGNESHCGVPDPEFRVCVFRAGWDDVVIGKAQEQGTAGMCIDVFCNYFSAASREQKTKRKELRIEEERQ